MAASKCAAALFWGDEAPAQAANVLAAAVVVSLTALNLTGDKAVGRAQVALVAVTLGILVPLMAAGLPGIDTAMLAPGKSVGALPVVSGRHPW